MEFRPTESQRAAIEEKGTILVSAAAGSGKTKVLVERVIKMLTDRQNPVMADRLLIVTFTKTAAAEMLSRIENRLYEEYEKDPDDELIGRQKYLIKSADICTIDSFCIRIVRDSFALCDIEPDFKVANYNSLALIRQDVLREIIDDRLRNPSESFIKLLKITNCKKDESNLIDTIDRLYEKTINMPFPKKYIDLLKAPYTMPFGAGNPWYEATFSVAKDEVKKAKKSVERFADETFNIGREDFGKYAQTLAFVVDTVGEAVESADWNKVAECVRGAAPSKLPNGSTDLMKSLKAGVAKNIKRINEFFSKSCAEIGDEIAFYSDAVQLLCKMLEDYSDKLFLRLKEENIFSFNDIEQMATNLLCTLDENGNICASARGKELISRYDEVLVDEFQDVNDLQNTLFEFISDNSKKLFAVGDVKQSIYGFRGSNPDIFLKKKNEYGEYSDGGNEKGKRITLSHNFRSRKGICDTVNFFFENIMTGDVGGLVYDDQEKLNNKIDYPNNNETDTDFLLVDKTGDESDEEVIKSEGKAIADYIKSIVSKRILSDKNGGLRPVRYGDICVLISTVTGKGTAVANVLKQQGIPAKVAKSDFLESTEIVTALALLSVINNPQKNVELLKVLMSPVYGFTAQELAEIRASGKNMSLYSALRLYAEKSEKAESFLSELSELRRMSCMIPIGRFVSYALDKTDMVNTFYSMPGGSLRAENLMKLMGIANEYSAGTSGSIFGFLKYVVSADVDSPPDVREADDGSVKVMSIHKSKGLQFPVCIVAGLSINKNYKDTAPPCLYSRNFGLAFKYFDTETFTKKENYGCAFIKRESNEEKVREKLRLLYVAMTRAEEKLCLVCCMKNAASALQKAADASDMGQNDISGAYIISAQNSALYMLAAAILHPDADKFRDLSQCDVKLRKTDSRINFEIINASDSRLEQTETEPANPDEELLGKLNVNIGYEYPFAALADIPAKTAVTALANREEAEAFAMTQRPAFMQKDGLSAAGRGTAIHKVMQFIEFSKSPDIEGEIKKLVSENRISENEAAAVDKNQLERFFKSSLYARILSSDTVNREMRFLTELPVSAYGGAAKDFDDKFIVQGAVDLCFTEDDGVVVVDFKTDKVDDLSVLKDRYAGQLGIYANACEKIFGIRVKEKIIYSFCLSDTVRV